MFLQNNNSWRTNISLISGSGGFVKQNRTQWRSSALLHSSTLGNLGAPIIMRCHILPSEAGGQTFTLTQLYFAFQSHWPISPASGLLPPPLAVHSVVRVEGRVEMQRLYHLNQFMCHEGQTPQGRFTVQPNTTAGDQHFNKQRRRSTNQWNGLMWHLVEVKMSRSCTWWGYKVNLYWEKVRSGEYLTALEAWVSSSRRFQANYFLL